MTIRTGKLKDYGFIKTELEKFSNFYDTGFSLYNKDSIKPLVETFIKDHVVYIAENKNEEPAGFIMGTFNPHPYNPALWALTESFWWVKEEHRNTGAGLKLLDKFIEFGKEYADFITLTLEDNSPIGEKHFLKRGFKIKEKSFLLEVK